MHSYRETIHRNTNTDICKQGSRVCRVKDAYRIVYIFAFLWPVKSLVALQNTRNSKNLYFQAS